MERPRSPLREDAPELPVSVAGLRVLFSEALAESLAVRQGVAGRDGLERRVFLHASRRIPSLFVENAPSRAAAGAALDALIDKMVEVSLPEEPIRIVQEVDAFLRDLLFTLESEGVTISGAEAFLQEIGSKADDPTDFAGERD